MFTLCSDPIEGGVGFPCFWKLSLFRCLWRHGRAGWINRPFPCAVVMDSAYPLGMGAVKRAEKARTCSIPIEKLAGFPGTCAPFFYQFTLELFGSALPGGLTIAEEFGIDERQKRF